MEASPLRFRRTSGEIVNATLMEVFLALTFLVLALVKETVSTADAAEATAAQLRDSLAFLERQITSRDSALARLREELNEQRFASKYPPDCGLDAGHPWLAEVRLLPRGTVDVMPLVSRFDLQSGTGFTVSLRQFTTRFAGIRDYSRFNGCRFRVRVRDTKETTKEEYKEALSVITSVFYTAGTFAAQ